MHFYWTPWKIMRAVYPWPWSASESFKPDTLNSQLCTGLKSSFQTILHFFLFAYLTEMCGDHWLLFCFVKWTTGTVFTARYLAFVKHFIAAFEQTFLSRLWFEDKNVNSQVLLWWSPSWLQCWAGATEKYCSGLRACQVFARSGPRWGVLLW